MEKHAGHDKTVHRIQDQDDVEDEQDEIAFAGELHHQQKHQAAQYQVGRVPEAGANGADILELDEHVDRDGKANDDIDCGDADIRDQTQPRIEFVLAQRIKCEQHEGDGHQRESQERRPADCRQIVLKQVDKKADGDDVKKNVRHRGYPRFRRRIGSHCSPLHRIWTGRGRTAPPVLIRPN